MYSFTLLINIFDASFDETVISLLHFSPSRHCEREREKMLFHWHSGECEKRYSLASTWNEIHCAVKILKWQEERVHWWHFCLLSLSLSHNAHMQHFLCCCVCLCTDDKQCDHRERVYSWTLEEWKNFPLHLSSQISITSIFHLFRHMSIIFSAVLHILNLHRRRIKLLFIAQNKLVRER